MRVKKRNKAGKEKGGRDQRRGYRARGARGSVLTPGGKNRLNPTVPAAEYASDDGKGQRFMS